MKISVVITTYNRNSVVGCAIRSVLSQPGFGLPHEIVVVDDASLDETMPMLARDFGSEIGMGALRLIENIKNLGVTGSKNAGFEAALGEWVIFLDSDDSLSEDAWGSMLKVLEAATSHPVVFFRCVDQGGYFVGRRFETELLLNLETYIEHTSYGEALTVINKNMVYSAPYITALRGYEGLGCCRIIARYGPAILSTVVARRYDQSGSDRLSVSSGLLRRLPLLARGHWMLVREFGSYMRPAKRLGFALKASVYFVVGGIYGLAKGKSS